MKHFRDDQDYYPKTLEEYKYEEKITYISGLIWGVLFGIMIGLMI